MSNRYEHEPFNVVGEVTNDAASLQILTARSGTGLYVYVEKINIAVFKAATGGGGIAKVIDSDGVAIFTINADGVKEVALDFGKEGYNIGENKGIQVVVSGAQSEQASVAVGISGHHSFRNL